ncbi:MAG: UbiA family prenyltransferase [Candidatus Pacebacteria bacterium]|nr:UbiA family prenyltransferase [Candidatus Paceibacterota bacterium]
MRPALLTGILLTFYMGNYWANKSHSSLNLWLPASIGLLLAFSFGNVMNDIYDQDIDRINEPNRPLVSGKLSQKDALVFAISSAVCAILASISSGIISIIGTSLIILLGIFYSHPKVQLSRKGWFSTFLLILAYYFIPFWSGFFLTTGSKPRLDAILLFGALLSLGISKVLLKDFKDVRGDTQYKKITPLSLLGSKKILIISSSLAIIGLLSLSFLAKLYIRTPFNFLIILAGTLYCISFLYPVLLSKQKTLWKQIPRVFLILLFALLLAA